MDFKTVLPRLVSAYESGRLVPFIGAGMSRRACTDWHGLVGKLEAQARLRGRGLKESTPSEEIVRRGNTAVRKLKAAADGDFARAMLAALVEKGGKKAPAQMRALSRLPWPLALTTNYDNCYAAAFQEFQETPCAVVGRGVEDCQRVLNSLSTAGRPLLWALQGYLNAPCVLQDQSARSSLTEELVVGHDEYRRVTYRDVHFRRAFAEVFRHRSLLFLGSGIRETYLQELFGEVLELYGPSTRPHYAFLPKGEVDTEFMLARFQIVVIEYAKGKHTEVPNRLRKLARAATTSARALVGWSWGRLSVGASKQLTSVPDFEVLLSPLPEAPPEKDSGECFAVSAGGREGGPFAVSGGIGDLVAKWGVNNPWNPQPTGSRYLEFHPRCHVFSVKARSKDDGRTLADVYDASFALFRYVHGKYRCIRMQLLGAGGKEEITESISGGKEKLTKPAPEYNQRPFAERFPFVQIVRAWGAWRRLHPDNDCRLVLHLVSPSVAADLASGRIDVLELLHCPDIRFAAEVVSDTGAVERRLFQEMPDTRLREIVSTLDLSAKHWEVEVSPAARLLAQVKSVAERLNDSLQVLEVVPGSTLHFRRRGTGGQRVAGASKMVK